MALAVCPVLGDADCDLDHDPEVDFRPMRAWFDLEDANILWVSVDDPNTDGAPLFGVHLAAGKVIYV